MEANSVDRWLIIAVCIAALFLAGQAYLFWRRRKVRRFFQELSRGLAVAGSRGRLDLIIGGHRVVVDAQVTSDDRPEELRLTLRSQLPGDLRWTRPAVAGQYADCKHGRPAGPGAPFAGWHVHTEDADSLTVLASDRRVREALETIAGSGFERIELTRRRLRALWPALSWALDGGESIGDSMPGRVRRAAGALSDLARVVESALRASGQSGRGSRVRATLTVLLLVPVFLLLAGIAALVLLYDTHPTVRDGQLLTAMVLAGLVVSSIYTLMAYLLLRGSIQRVARTAVVGVVSFLGFALGSSGPILWWNGTGPQGPGQPVVVEVVRVSRESALASGKGMLIRKVIGENTRVEEWTTTHRAIVRSWRDDSLLGIGLAPEQYSALLPGSGRLSLTVFPGALGLEWYRDVGVLTNPPESLD